jgi:hypothetical protein
MHDLLRDVKGEREGIVIVDCELCVKMTLDAWAGGAGEKVKELKGPVFVLQTTPRKAGSGGGSAAIEPISQRGSDNRIGLPLDA